MPKTIKPSKKQPKPTLSNLVEVRLARGENQHQFWTRFGVTQSGGSRYENGRNLPKSTGMLVMLYLTGVIDEAALAKVAKVINKKA